MNLETSNFQNQPQNFKNLGDLFSLEDVCLSFGEHKALKSIKLNIKKGEILFITGASGAGKTSLLKIIAGDLLPTSGKVKGIGESGGFAKNLFVSQVFQDLRLISKETCDENICHAYDPSIYKNKKEFISDKEELCRYLGITDRLGLKIKDANGGLKQKVAIVRALLTKPDVFIADEPTSSLDSENARRLFDLLSVFNIKRGMTVIWASHNKELVKKFTGRIIHLDKGKLIYTGHACFI
jgi:ABC-type multidrug transport system ATPase subunit